MFIKLESNDIINSDYILGISKVTTNNTITLVATLINGQQLRLITGKDDKIIEAESERMVKEFNKDRLVIEKKH